MAVQIGDEILAFNTKITPGDNISVDYLSNRNIVFFFYPKDNTPGCTIENKEFGSYYDNFSKSSWDILGCSRDSIKSHLRFKEKLNLPYQLASDIDESLCGAFGVLVEKNMFGKKVRGIERSTFLIKNGILIEEWRKVKAEGHAKIVLDKVKQFS